MTAPQEPQEPQDGMSGLEAAFAALVLAALTSWLGQVTAGVMRPWRLWQMMPDPTAIAATVPFWTDKVTQLIRWLRGRAVPEGIDRFREDHPRAPHPIISTDSFIQAHLARVENYLVRIPDEVYQGVFAEISEGVNEGEGVMEIAERVDQMLRVSGSENWPARARVISITEVNGASNAGWMAAAIQMQDLLGEPLNKEWVSSHDSRVRETHQEADGQRRPLLTPFTVGGWPLMYPGDKAGPPEEVINCRCTAVTTEEPIR